MGETFAERVNAAVEATAGPQRAIEELRRFAEVAVKRTRRSEERWVVRVNDSGSPIGPSVDLRKWIEPTAYAETELQAAEEAAS
jgi:hypothetical protein